MLGSYSSQAGPELTKLNMPAPAVSMPGGARQNLPLYPFRWARNPCSLLKASNRAYLSAKRPACRQILTSRQPFPSHQKLLRRMVITLHRVAITLAALLTTFFTAAIHELHMPIPHSAFKKLRIAKSRRRG